MSDHRVLAGTRSFRRVAAAVDAVCAVAADAHSADLDAVVGAIAHERHRDIEIASASLAPGICGQRRRYPDRDVIVLSSALPNRDWTLAHELGHIVFDHPGTSARETVLEASDDLIAYMLSQRAYEQAVDHGGDALAEWEAETFANMLLTRLRVINYRDTGVARLRLDEALG
jgi:IrrE N-terminal-like domain